MTFLRVKLQNRRREIAIAVAFVLSSSTLSGQQKPVITRPVFIDSMPAPVTLSEFAAGSHAIVRAKVAEARNVVVTQHERLSARTDYSLVVLEILKGGPTFSVGSQITVERLGGDVDSGSAINRSFDPAFPPFQVGDPYVLFLLWSNGKYQVAWGPDGAFHISAGVINAMGRGPVAKELDGRSADEVLQTIRSAAGGR